MLYHADISELLFSSIYVAVDMCGDCAEIDEHGQGVGRFQGLSLSLHADSLSSLCRLRSLEYFSFSASRSSISSAVSFMETLRGPRSFFFFVVEHSDLPVDLPDFLELEDLYERVADARVLEVLVRDPEPGLEALVGLASDSRLLEFGLLAFLFFFFGL